MQRLLSVKLTLNLPKTLSISTTTTSSSLFHFQRQKTLSLTKPPQTQTQNHFFSSFPSHPLYRQHKVHGFFSNPLLRKHFSLDSANTLLRLSSKKLSDCRLAYLQTQFPKQSFNFKPSQNYHHGVRSSWFQTISSNDLVFGLILANVIVFLSWWIVDPLFLYHNFTTSLFNFMLGHVHTMVTPAITHASAGHLIFNMIGLCYFGRNIGRVFGPEFLLKLYIAGAIGGSVFHLVHHAFLYQTTPVQGRRAEIRNKPAFGASGAVNAIMLLDIFLHPAVPAVLLGIFLIGKDIPRIMEGNAHVKGSTHLGGAVVAAIAWARLRRGLRVF
ncbi:hypothetical protein ACLB2K_052053 [Fragaria x ananassa]